MKYLRGGLIDGFAPFVYEGPSTGLGRLVNLDEYGGTYMFKWQALPYEHEPLMSHAYRSWRDGENETTWHNKLVAEQEGLRTGKLRRFVP